MTDSIIKLREQLVELSKDPIETRKLLDQLTEEEIDQANIESPFHVGKNDIEETKDLEFAKIHKTRNGYLLHYHGGYSVLVDNKLISTAQALQSVLDGTTGIVDDKEREAVDLVTSAIEMVFRLPMFVFSQPNVMFTLAEIGVRYMLLLQKIGEVPTEETENAEFDQFLVQMNEMLENLATGLEKQGLEYEERMGHGKGQGKSQGENQGEGETEA